MPLVGGALGDDYSMIPLRWQLNPLLGQRLMFAADVRLVAVGALVVDHRCVWLLVFDGIDIAVVVDFVFAGVHADGCCSLSDCVDNDGCGGDCSDAVDEFGEWLSLD